MRWKHTTFALLLPLLMLAIGLPQAAAQKAAQNAAQTYNAPAMTTPIDLAETHWAFQQGDDPAWASPDFDDAQWKIIDPKQPLGNYASLNSGPVFWYRLHIRLNPLTPDPAIRIFTLARAYSIYANGHRLLQRGGSPGHEIQTYNPLAVLALPGPDNGKPQTVVLALRCVLLGSARSVPRPLLAPGKITLGRFSELETARKFTVLSTDGAIWAICILQLAVGLLTWSLYLTQRSQRDYLWLALLAIVGASWNILGCTIDLISLPRQVFLFGTPLLDSLQMIGYLGFYSAFTRRRPDLWTWLVCACAALNLVVEILILLGAGLPEPIAYLLFALCWAPLTFYPMLKLAQAVRRGVGEAWIMFIPFVCLSIEFNVRVLFQILASANLIPEVPAFFNGFTVLFLQWNSQLCARVLFWFFVLGLTVLRSNRISRQHATIANEVEAARQIQQVLLPDPHAQVPGFLTESVYLPASQVGGDFFQLLPTPNGGLLIIVGDVAGKGLPAAMLVSVLVGAIRSEAAHDTNPARILSALNQTLLGQARGGFATCLCATIDTSGSMTIANAGHLSPYHNGQELELPGALPLGLVPGIAYEATTIPLQPGSRLTFYSDGVPEAQKDSGEMLGFARAQQLSTQPAQTIANAASNFGQTDDITVLTVTRTS